MKRFRLPFVAVVFGLAAVAGLRAAPVPPQPAPAWTLQDLAGQAVSSEQFKGKVLVVDFWATWCGPCREEIPGYVALQKKYGRDKLVVIGIEVGREGPSVVKKFMEKNGVDYQIVMGTDEVVTAFGGDEPIQAIPTTFIVDRAGNIVDRKMGAEPTEVFEQRLAKYLK